MTPTQLKLRLDGLRSINTNPISSTDQTSRVLPGIPEEPLQSPLSSRSSYYVATPDREIFLGSLEETMTPPPSPMKRSMSFARKLWRSRRTSSDKIQQQVAPVPQMQEQSDRLEKYVKFRDAKATEEAMLKERSPDDGLNRPRL